jgi:hypothetical protein
MAEYSATKLKNQIKKNPFPIESLDPKEKQKDKYGAKIAKFIYFRGISQDLSSNRRVIAQENRDYATNRNDINKYKPLLDAAFLYDYRLE